MAAVGCRLDAVVIDSFGARAALGNAVGHIVVASYPMPPPPQEHLDQVYESHIKRATCVRFSNGGGMFAAVGRNNTITLTSTYPFRAQQQLGQLKGHATAVTELAFGSDDRMLVSAGVGGAL